ncbi:MAG: bifunctional demethylmenaquinone methyltransferase/2-methoxy-6-polyprenyl-1,4-benzoquinol methylase UbiE [Acidobacteriota bacterium]|nr:bifunctional demethylmenaquinone methyltransferase/2-methoxy-6-polyprenyl-1,4-benzoquinol methylase UbiE [Acidobacteriota bacterium]
MKTRGTTRGTTPEGAATEEEAARWVRSMFGRVAHRYDLANHLLSFNIDRYWRARTVRRVSRLLQTPGTRALDLCCGTGDLLIALQRQRPAAVLGSDFCHPMLTAARAKVAARRLPARLFEADALRLPLADGSLDLITIAFGFRNLANYQRGLEELRRVLRSGGMVAILEFSQPPNRAFAQIYRLYSRHILPLIGGALSGSRDAYSYLPESVRKFPSAEELARQMMGAGFHNVGFERMTGGIVALHLGSVTQI